MEHSTFWPAVRRWVWVPILTALAATAVAMVIAVRAPQYEATASVFTRQQTSNNGPALDFSDIATSNIVLTRALHDVAATDSVEQLQSRLSVVVSRSSVYRVTVADANAQHAASLANAVAAESARLYEDLGAGNANSVVDQINTDRTHYRDLYLAASQALFNFQTQHPETAALLALTHGSSASGPDAPA
jgi:capsular polysaccharide biosynthesis protein